MGGAICQLRNRRKILEAKVQLLRAPTVQFGHPLCRQSAVGVDGLNKVRADNQHIYSEKMVQCQVVCLV